jgi:hypothetical protein
MPTRSSSPTIKPATIKIRSFMRSFVLETACRLGQQRQPSYGSPPLIRFQFLEQRLHALGVKD